MSTRRDSPRPIFTRLIIVSLQRERRRRLKLAPLAQLEIASFDKEVVEEAFFTLSQRYDPARFRSYGVEAERAAMGIIRLLDQARWRAAPRRRPDGTDR